MFSPPDKFNSIQHPYANELDSIFSTIEDVLNSIKDIEKK